MSPENTHKLMGFYMEGLILGVNTMYMLFCFFKLFLVGCTGLIIIAYCCAYCKCMMMTSLSCTQATKVEVFKCV